MKAIEFSQFGGPEVLRVNETEMSALETGRVRVRIEARAVNAADLRIRAGAMSAVMPDRPFPIRLGWDFVGSVMTSSAEFSEGQRVLGIVPWLSDRDRRGSYAEIIDANADWLAPLPDGLSATIASTLPLNGLAASQLIDALEIREGQTLLVVGASGTVGAYVAQLAVAANARVFAVAAEGDEDYVASLGVEMVLTQGSGFELAAQVREHVPAGVDGLADAVPVGPDLIAAVRDGGRFATVLQARAPEPQRNIRVNAIRVVPNSQRLSELAYLAAKGELVVRIAAKLPLKDAAEAHRRAADSANGRGRIVLVE